MKDACDNIMDVCLGRPDSKLEPELNALANPNAPSHSSRSETHVEPEAEASTLAGTDIEIGVNDRRVRFREERDSPRHHLDASSDRESMVEPRGQTPSRAETSEFVVPFHSSEASPSELQQVSTTAASDTPTGERLYMSMTQEGPSGEYKMTMQRDRHGRWMPTKGERTMNIQKAREERRRFYVGESKDHGTFSIASAEASTQYGKFYFSRRNANEVSWKHFSAEEQMQFPKANETEWPGVMDYKAVTIIDSTQADVIREKHREPVISSRLVLRWKETDTGYNAKARWCVHGFKDPDTHTRLSAVAQRQSCCPSTSHCRSWTSDPSVRDEPLYATPPTEGLPCVPEGALIRLDPWRSRIVSPLKEEGYEMNVCEPCLFSKFAVREEPAVDGGAPGEFCWLCSV